LTSSALANWRSHRAERLDELYEAHARVGGTSPGRRIDTEQINWSLVLRLAGEFQGFARELHDLGAETFSGWAAGGNAQLQTFILALLTRERVLDRGNAQPGGLGADFGRFGLAWWPELTLRDVRTKRRQEKLEKLNEARNAIAHANVSEIATLRGDGYPLTLDTVTLWRNALNGLAVTMDDTLAAHLAAVFGRQPPW
jgi:hypothetical protein